jgi:hypothetical protein
MEGSFPDAVPGHRKRSRHAIVKERISEISRLATGG